MCTVFSIGDLFWWMWPLAAGSGVQVCTGAVFWCWSCWWCSGGGTCWWWCLVLVCTGAIIGTRQLQGIGARIAPDIASTLFDTLHQHSGKAKVSFVPWWFKTINGWLWWKGWDYDKARLRFSIKPLQPFSFFICPKNRFWTQCAGFKTLYACANTKNRVMFVFLCHRYTYSVLTAMCLVWFWVPQNSVYRKGPFTAFTF